MSQRVREKLAQLREAAGWESPQAMSLALALPHDFMARVEQGLDGLTFDSACRIRRALRGRKQVMPMSELNALIDDSL